MTLVYFLIVVCSAISSLVAVLILAFAIISSRTKERTNEELIDYAKKRGQRILDQRFSDDITLANIDIKEHNEQRYK